MTDQSLNEVLSKAYWQKCNVCKKEIPFQSKYYICSVTTCQSVKLGLHFCSVPCWDSHLGFARHKDAAAIESTSPSKNDYLANLNKEAPARRIIAPLNLQVDTSQPLPKTQGPIEVDTLVVVSKVKKLISDQSTLNTSQCAIDALTQKVVSECLKAIENAKAAGRKTVMGRDIN